MSVNFDRTVRSIFVGAKDGSFQPIKQNDRVLKFTFEDNETKADKLVLSIKNDDLIHLDSPLWRKGNVIRIGWGYGGILSPIREVVIDKVSGGTILKVEASGGEVVHNKIRLNNRLWKNKKRSEVVRDLGFEMGFTAEQMIIQDTEYVFGTISVATLTRTQFLKQLAKREGYDFYIDFDGLHFHERDLTQKPQVTLRYHVGGGKNGTSDIISFNFAKGVDAAKPGSIRVQGRDPYTKEDFDYTANNASVPRTSLGSALSVTGPEAVSEDPLNSKIVTDFIIPTTELNSTAMRRYAQGLYKRVQLNAIELKVKARGIPGLLAKGNIRIAGVGPTLSGIYYITQIKHNVGGGPYTMNLVLKRDALTMAVVPTEQPLPGQGDGVASQGSVNESETQEPGVLSKKATEDGIEYVEPERTINLKLQS